MILCGSCVLFRVCKFSLLRRGIRTAVATFSAVGVSWFQSCRMRFEVVRLFAWEVSSSTRRPSPRVGRIRLGLALSHLFQEEGALRVTLQAGGTI